MRLWLPPLLALVGLGMLPAAGAQGLSDAINSLPDCAVLCNTPFGWPVASAQY